ncbi:MAG: XRE family transcriptional regulator, partial [Rhodospirillales bacterium]|nr:XRE family transcriptional regulator [Rhodospirillales bacterium]
MTSAVSFAVVLRGARRAAGLTQDGLAHSAGVGLRTVQELERGSAQPRRETLRRLCTALGVPFEEWAPFVAGSRPRKHVALPAVRTSFVGREPELRDGLARLSAGRLLTLVGPGGVGKTRLARELVSRTGADWVAWVELNGQAAVSPLATLASQLRVAGGDRLDGIVAELTSAAAPALVFDGCEHALDQCVEAAAALLDRCPSLRVVCTSRTPLRMYGEAVLQLEPLGLPERDGPSAEIASSAAVRLFLERSALVGAPLAPTGESGRLVAEICRRVDGLPLGIELAAAATATLSLRDVAERLATGGALQLDGFRDAPHQQRSLRAVLAWSHDLLSEQTRLVFRRLAVFAGTFAVESAEAVCGPLGGTLSELAEHSLLVPVGDSRYRLLDTIREYAWERLDAAGETAEFRQRHLRYFAELVERATPLLRGTAQQLWLQRLDAELPNLLAAAEWAQEDARPERLTLALPMLSRPWRYWFASGSSADAFAALERLLALTGPPPWDDELRRARANGLGGACVLALHLGDAGAALRFGEESRALQGEDGHDSRADCVALALAMAHLARSEFRAARPLLREAIVDGERLGDDEVVAFSNLYLGRSLAAAGEAGAAEACFDAATAAFERMGDQWGEASVLLGRGVLERGRDQVRAEELLEASVGLFRAHGDRGWCAQALAELARLRQIRGELAAARELLDESELMAAGAGYRERAAERLWYRAMLEAECGDREAAVAAWGRAAGEAVAAGQSEVVAALLATAALWASDRPALALTLLGASRTQRVLAGVAAPPEERPRRPRPPPAARGPAAAG